MTRAWLLCAFLLACQETPGPGPAASATGPAPSASTPPAGSTDPGGAYRDEDLPVTGDFEEEAEKTVTDANYKQKRDEIAAELAAEGGVPAPSSTPSSAPSSAPSR